VTGTLILDGRITANGNNGSAQGSGGGSGGSILLTLGGFSGTGLITANGGAGESPSGGGGGGGRIAIYYTGPNSSFSGSLSAHGGSGANNGSAGTVYSQANNTKSNRLTIDNGGLNASNTVFAVQSGDLILSGSALASPSSSSLSIGSLFIKSNSWLIFSNANHSLTTMTVDSNQ